MPTKKISLEKLIQTRHSFRRDEVEAIKETIKKDKGVDLLFPIYCDKMEDIYFIWNGNHRYLAAKELGYKSMWVEYD